MSPFIHNSLTQYGEPVTRLVPIEETSSHSILDFLKDSVRSSSWIEDGSEEANASLFIFDNLLSQSLGGTDIQNLLRTDLYCSCFNMFQLKLIL
jgi:hypothetical protein